MMEESQESLFKLALQTHGIIFSESGSDSDDGLAEFDHTHELNKPPPLDPEFIRKNLVVIHPKENENVWAKRMEDRSKKAENIKVDPDLCPISNPSTTVVPDVENSSGISKKIHPKENENVLAKCMEGRSKIAENIKVDPDLCPISNPSTTVAPDVKNSSGISEKKVTKQKLEITEHGSPITPAVKAEITYVDSKSHLLHDTFMETSNQSQSSLEINNSLANMSLVAEIGKLSKKKKKKKKKKKGKKKSASEKNIEDISTERASPIAEIVGNSVSTEVGAKVTHLENVESNSGLSENKVTNQKLDLQTVKSRIKFVDRDLFKETSNQRQPSLKIGDLVINMSSVAEIIVYPKENEKKNNRKKKSASAENFKENSVERASHSIVERVENSGSTKVDAGVTGLENASLHDAPPEMKASKINIRQLNAIPPKEANVHEDATKSNVYENLQEQTNCRKEISSTGQINGIKKKKLKFLPITIIDNSVAKESSEAEIKKKKRNMKKKSASEKNIIGNSAESASSSIAERIGDYVSNKDDVGVAHLESIDYAPSEMKASEHYNDQSDGISPEIQYETENIKSDDENGKNNFVLFDTDGTADKNNKITKIIDIKEENVHEEITTKSNSYENLQEQKFSTTTQIIKECHNQQNSPKRKKLKSEGINLQDQTNDCNKDLSFAKTETSSEKKKKTKLVISNLLDETISTIPPVAHTQQNSLNSSSSDKEQSSEKSASGTKKKTKVQLDPCNTPDESLATITSKAEFSRSQLRTPNNKTSNLGSGPLLPYSGYVDKIIEVPHFGHKNIHLPGACVPFSKFDEEMKKLESNFLHVLNYQQNITNNREGTSRSDNELTLMSGAKKINKKKGKVSHLKTNQTKTDKNIFSLSKFGFPSNLDLERHLGFFNQSNSCRMGFSTFNGNIREHEDETYRKKEPYYEKSIIRTLAKFDTGKVTNSKTNCVLSFATELETTFSETEWHNKQITSHIFGYRPKTLWTDLNSFKNIQYGLEIYLYSGNTLEAHNLKEIDSYPGMCLDFVSKTGEQESSCKVEKRISVLVQPSHDFSLKENAITDYCFEKDFMYKESAKETRKERGTLTESNEEEMLRFTIESEETNGDSVRRDNTILKKADGRVSGTSDYYEISCMDEKYSDNELTKTRSHPIKNEINQKTIRTVIETSKVPYALTKIVQLIFVYVFLLLVISFMNWVTDNCLPLTLFFMCIVILNITK